MVTSRLALGVAPGTVRGAIRKATARGALRAISRAICRRNLTVTWTEVCGLIQKATGKATVKVAWDVTLVEVRTRTRSVTPHATCGRAPRVVLGVRCGEIPEAKSQVALCLPVRACGLE